MVIAIVIEKIVFMAKKITGTIIVCTSYSNIFHKTILQLLYFWCHISTAFYNLTSEMIGNPIT